MSDHGNQVCTTHAERDLASMEFVRLHGEHEELVRLGRQIVDASTQELGWAIGQMRTYLKVLEERGSLVETQLKK